MEEVDCMMTRINWNLRIYDDNPCYITLLLHIKQNSTWANQVPWTLSLSLSLKILPWNPLGSSSPLSMNILCSLLDPCNEPFSAQSSNFSVCFTSVYIGHKTLVWPTQTRHQTFYDVSQQQGLAQTMVIELQDLEKCNRRLENFKWYQKISSCRH